MLCHCVLLNIEGVNSNMFPFQLHLTLIFTQLQGLDGAGRKIWFCELRIFATLLSLRVKVCSTASRKALLQFSEII